MENLKRFTRYLAAGLLLIPALSLSAQRHSFRGRSFGGRATFSSFARVASPVYAGHSIVPALGYASALRYNALYYPYGILGLGLTFATLPFGYSTFYYGNLPYYYNDGFYYRPNADNGYQVVAPPVGAKVPTLPSGAKLETINGQPYYTFNGSYYRQEQTAAGEIMYEVVSKNEVLNNDGISNIPATNTPASNEAAEKMGDETDKLPDNSKSIIINNQKYYESASGWYYQEMKDTNGDYYKIVGKANQPQ